MNINITSKVDDLSKVKAAREDQTKKNDYINEINRKAFMFNILLFICNLLIISITNNIIYKLVYDNLPDKCNDINTIQIISYTIILEIVFSIIAYILLRLINRLILLNHSPFIISSIPFIFIIVFIFIFIILRDIFTILYYKLFFNEQIKEDEYKIIIEKEMITKIMIFICLAVKFILLSVNYIKYCTLCIKNQIIIYKSSGSVFINQDI